MFTYCMMAQYFAGTKLLRKARWDNFWTIMKSLKQYATMSYPEYFQKYIIYCMFTLKFTVCLKQWAFDVNTYIVPLVS